MNSENTISADTAPLPPVTGAGAHLRAAREALGLDVSHIAAETRIPRRHLEAIEAGDYESLPSRAYAIGFSRTYAKIVGLDPAMITDEVRLELADGSMRRTMPTPGIEPGDPARLPSAGLAWAAAGAVLILALGIFAFYNSYFGAGTEPDELLAPGPVVTTAAALPAPSAAAVPTGPVVLTAMEDGIWVRIYEEGGARLAERTLMQGDTLEVPANARDPRINTGRPDALGVTIGGQSVAKLSDRAQTISGVPVSAAALGARPAGSTTAASAPVVAAPQPAPRPVARRAPQPAAQAAEVPAPAPAPTLATDTASPDAR